MPLKRRRGRQPCLGHCSKLHFFWLFEEVVAETPKQPCRQRTAPQGHSDNRAPRFLYIVPDVPVVFMCICLSVCLPARLSVCLSVCLSVHTYACMHVCMSMYVGAVMRACVHALVFVHERPMYGQDFGSKNRKKHVLKTSCLSSFLSKWL